MAENSFFFRARQATARVFSDAGLDRLAADTLQYDWRRGVCTAPLAFSIGNARLRSGDNQQASLATCHRSNPN